MSNGHVPVLLKEVLSGLSLAPGDDAIDGTLGGGGHASAILEATGPTGRLLGIEWDGRTLEETRKRLDRFGSRAMLVHGSYRQMESLARSYGLPSVSGIVLDLGYSSFQIDDPDRGFSFRFDGRLDMRYDEDSDGPTAADILNTWSKEELVRILRDYGEERGAGRIAQAVIEARHRKPFANAEELAALVRKTVGKRGMKIHPATQTFQALRIAVNDELGNLEAVLPQIERLLKADGIACIISFHSLEDRIVKEFFKQSSGLEILTKRPITPSEKEIDMNPRARSAKLRVARKRSHA